MCVCLFVIVYVLVVQSVNVILTFRRGKEIIKRILFLLFQEHHTHTSEFLNLNFSVMFME